MRALGQDLYLGAILFDYILKFKSKYRSFNPFKYSKMQSQVLIRE